MKIPLRMDALALFAFSTSPSINHKTQGRAKTRLFQQVESRRETNVSATLSTNIQAKSVAVQACVSVLVSLEPCWHGFSQNESR